MSTQSRYVGDAVDWDEARQLMQIAVKNRFASGDRLELMHPQGNRKMVVRRMENAAGEPVNIAPGNPHSVWIDAPEDCRGAFVARLYDDPQGSNIAESA